MTERPGIDPPQRMTWRFGAVAIPVVAERRGGLWVLEARGQRHLLTASDVAFAKAAAQLKAAIEAKLAEHRALRASRQVGKSA